MAADYYRIMVWLVGILWPVAAVIVAGLLIVRFVNSSRGGR